MAMYLIVAENGTSSPSPVAFSLRGTSDGTEKETNVTEERIEEFRASPPPTRRFYFNGKTGYCVCDDEKCKEMRKRATGPGADNHEKDRYQQHLRFMTNSLYENVHNNGRAAEAKMEKLREKSGIHSYRVIQGSIRG
jgi:hypothetical protein